MGDIEMCVFQPKDHVACQSYGIVSRKGSMTVGLPLDRTTATFCRLSIVTMCSSAVVWAQFLMQAFNIYPGSRRISDSVADKAQVASYYH